MSRKTIFLSAVSRELGPLRQLFDDAFSRHFDVITQERSLNENHGRGIHEVLKDAIDRSDCVIHLVGRGFGSTADQPFQDHGNFPCSWTQFEYYYGHLTGKPVFALVCSPSLADPSFQEEPDQLSVSGKAKLQTAHSARVASGEFTDTPFHQLKRTSNNGGQEKSSKEELLKAAIAICTQMAETDPTYDGVKGELDQMLSTLGRIETRQKRHLLISTMILLGVAALGGGSWWAYKKLSKKGDQVIQKSEEVAKSNQTFDMERARLALKSEVNQTADKKLAELKKASAPWQEIDKIQKWRDQELAKIEDDIARYKRGFEAAGATETYKTALEIMQQAKNGGIDAALAYLQSRREETLRSAGEASLSLAAAQDNVERKKEELQNKLAPLFLEADQLEKKLDYVGLRKILEDAAKIAPNSYEARNRLGLHYLNLAMWKEAETELTEAKRLAAGTSDEATSLNNLAQLLQATNRLAEAEPLMRRALSIDEASYGKDHPNVARNLNNLAQLLQDTNRLAEAEPLMRRALSIDEASYGKDHPDVARDLNNLAQLLQATNRLAEAEPLMRRALSIDEASYGKDHPDVEMQRIFGPKFV